MSILLKRNLTYSQIAMLLQKQIVEGCINNEFSTLKFTKKEKIYYCKM